MLLTNSAQIYGQIISDPTHSTVIAAVGRWLAAAVKQNRIDGTGCPYGANYILFGKFGFA